MAESSPGKFNSKTCVTKHCPGFGLARAIEILSPVQTSPGAREHLEEDCTELGQGGQ